MKRKLNDHDLREFVRARITKGSAFNPPREGYDAEQERVRAELAAMSRDDIFAKYPYATYDIKQ